MPVPRVHVVGAAILEDGRCVVARRGPGMSLPGRWEFPGGKREPGESRPAALERELAEELGLRARIGDWLGRGEAQADGRRVVLDVYAAAIAERRPRPREHAELRWLRGDELGALDWAPADIPVLPAVRARLDARPQAQQCPRDVVLVSADWSKEPRKRAVYVARHAPHWEIARAEPPPQGWSLTRLLELAGALGRQGGRGGRPVLVGIDAVLGLPTAFARAAGFADFPTGVARLAAAGGLAQESGSPQAWRAERPFFRVPAGRGGLSGFVAAAGGRGATLRQLELRSGAKPVFVLAGIPGSVGSGSRALWRELAPVLAEPQRALRVWPFDGPLDALLAKRGAVLAETYPRACYALALAAELPARPRALAKTRHPARRAALAELAAAGWIARNRVALHDLAAAERSEDDFDALFVVAGLARLVEAGEPLAAEPVDPRCEGGILGTGGLTLPVPGLPPL